MIHRDSLTHINSHLTAWPQESQSRRISFLKKFLACPAGPLHTLHNYSWLLPLRWLNKSGLGPQRFHHGSPLNDNSASVAVAAVRPCPWSWNSACPGADAIGAQGSIMPAELIEHYLSLRSKIHTIDLKNEKEHITFLFNWRRRSQS